MRRKKLRRKRQQRQQLLSRLRRKLRLVKRSSALTEEAREQVDAHIAALLGNNASVRLEGHTDERGTREYNLALGERRANAVRDYMVANGVPSYRIETISYGEENPVAYGSGESNWQQNRRVELK
jgi:peptidoglycan-associated lipoprotein